MICILQKIKWLSLDKVMTGALRCVRYRPATIVCFCPVCPLKYSTPYYFVRYFGKVCNSKLSQSTVRNRTVVEMRNSRFGHKYYARTYGPMKYPESTVRRTRPYAVLVYETTLSKPDVRYRTVRYSTVKVRYRYCTVRFRPLS
jgi:hypothetical protein